MAKGYILQTLFNILPYFYIYYFLKVTRKVWKNKRLKSLILADSRMLVPTQNIVLTKMQITETMSSLPFEHKRPA